MSLVALQRVMVRMLYDPVFTSQVLSDPAHALAGIELTAEEREWLRRPDRRAWSVDLERPARSLGSLLQRYPTSAALAMRSPAGLEALRGFFRSARFHRCIQERGSMAVAFGDHLADLVESGEIGDRRALPLARLEQAIAELHRTASPKPPLRDPGAASYRLSPDVSLLRVPSGTASLHESVHRALLESDGGPLGAILDPSRALPSDQVDFAREELLLLELVRGDGPRVTHLVGTTGISEELYALLAFASQERSREELAAEVVRLGADEADASEVVAGLIGDGTLVPLQRPLSDCLEHQ